MRFRMIHSGGLVLVLALFAFPSEAQRFSDWSAPVNLGPVVNTAAGDTCPAISKDGLTLYFARSASEIWFTTRESLTAPWAPPQRLPAPINVAGSANFCPVLVVNGHYLYFVSDRSGGCGGNDMYVSFRKDKRDNLGWETPVNLGCQVNSPQGDTRPSPFEGDDGTEYLYFSSSRPGGLGGLDIYVSTMQSDGTFGPPARVDGLNTTFADARPNVRERDGLEIFFDSNRGGGSGGFDLWTSTRASVSDPWSTPTNLGPIVNSSATEQRPSLSWDGTALYFLSDRPGGSGGIDLWVTTRTKLTGHVFPSVANVQGRNGAFFKTSVKLLNPNGQEISITASLTTPSGPTAAKVLVLPPNSYQTYDNFLQDVFGFTGGAGLALDSPASQPFVAVGEVYTESAAGRYSTPLVGLNATDAVAGSSSGSTSVSAGLRVTSGTRANFGCSNLNAAPATVRVDFSAITNDLPAATSTILTLGPFQWLQQAVPISGSDIFAFFSLTAGGGPAGVYCYGINVDNASNDGTAIPAVRMP
jgi:hypothetical protein